VQNTLYLKLRGNNNRLIVRNLLGQVVFDNQVNSTYQLDMTRLNAGLYFLQIENELGTMSGKVIRK
jgi:hypothetical protein